MTLYLTDLTPPGEDRPRAKASGIVHGVKLYPAGATTHSDAGVTDIRKAYGALARMEELGHAPAGAWRGRRRRRGRIRSRSEVHRSGAVTPDRAVSRAARGLRAHHDARGPPTSSARRAPAWPRPSRRSTCCTIATPSSPAASRPHYLLPADPEARARPRGAARGRRPAAIRDSSSAPTARRTSARPRRTPAAAPACSRPMRRSNSMRKPSSRRAGSTGCEAIRQPFRRGFLRGAAPCRRHHSDQGALGAARSHTISATARWCPIAAASALHGGSPAAAPA